MKNIKKHEIAIFLGWVVYCLATFLRSKYFETFNLFTATQEEATLEWAFRLAGSIGLTLALCLMVIFGIREIRRNGFSFNKTISPLFAIFFMVLLSFYGFYANSIIKETNSKLYSQKFFEEVESEINNKSIPLKKRAQLSEIYAQMKYEEEGVLVEHISPEGQYLTYEQTPESKANREERIKGEALLKWSQNTTKRAGIQWLTLLALSVFFGFFPNIKKPSNKLINRTENASALN